MLQTATYWGRPTDDGLGVKTFPAPVLLEPPEGVRWEQKAELFQDAEANEVVSAAVVYAGRPLEVEGWLALGDQTATSDPRNLSGAHRIRQTGAVPNLRQTQELHKAWL